MSNPCYKLLHSEKIAELGSGSAVHVLTEDMTVEQAVNKLAKWHVQSAPVVNKEGKVVSNLDVLDVVSFICEMAPTKWQLEHQHLMSLEISGRAIALELVKKVTNASGRDALVPLFEDSPATEAVGLLSEGLHRVAVANRDGSVLSIVSQMDLVAFLAGHLHMGNCKEMGALTLDTLGLGKVDPVSVLETETVLVALQKLKESGVSALAVVNSSGKLVGNFSASDLVGLYRESYPDFLLSVHDYLQKYSHRSLVPFKAHGSDTLLATCKELVATHVHRVWIVDGSDKPTGVVSLTDIMKIVREYSS